MAEQESHIEAAALEPARCFEHQNFKAVRPCAACGEAEVEARIMRTDPLRNERRDELDRSITIGLVARVALVIPALYFSVSAIYDLWRFRKNPFAPFYLSVMLIPMLILCGWWAYEVWKKR